MRGYRYGVAWIASNDEPTRLDHEEVAGFISTLLLADLTDKDPMVVAKAIVDFRLARAKVQRFYTTAPATYDYPIVTTSWGFATDTHGNKWRRIAISFDERRSPGHASTQRDRYLSGICTVLELERGAAFELPTSWPDVTDADVVKALQLRDEEV